MVSALRRVTFSLLVQRESNQRESTPGIRVWLRQTPLPPALFRGSSRRAIPGPSFLVWHPCQTPLSTAPPLGLLTGFGARVAYTICGRQKQKAKASRASPLLQFAVLLKTPFSQTTPTAPLGGRNVAQRSNSRRLARRASAASSGIVVEGSEPHGCGERRKGPGTALYAGPWNNDGARKRSEAQ